ncbi:hypothetical protein EYF80_013867 [Liparis tanakae]|uniref:Uncharacterized protein n=1 Tax=Liparis tanakae TaxID=230148 RepID=A0A4Z2IDA9_9TELE|nr:hypothetical protein EYF80_013867 [Liparis tanakae]
MELLKPHQFHQHPTFNVPDAVEGQVEVCQIDKARCSFDLGHSSLGVEEVYFYELMACFKLADVGCTFSGRVSWIEKEKRKNRVNFENARRRVVTYFRHPLRRESSRKGGAETENCRALGYILLPRVGREEMGIRLVCILHRLDDSGPVRLELSSSEVPLRTREKKMHLSDETQTQTTVAAKAAHFWTDEGTETGLRVMKEAVNLI